MKKFYATMAAALACTAMVAAPHSGVKTINGQALNLQFAPEGATPVLASNPGKVAKQLNVNTIAQSRSDEDIDVSGEYLVMCEMQGETVTGSTSLIQNDNVVTFNEFLFIDAENFDGNVVYDEEYGVWTVVIPGDGQTVLAEGGGQQYCMWLYAKYTDGKYYIFTNDLEFFVFEITPGSYELAFAYEDAGIFYGYEAEDGFYGGTLLNPDLMPMNCTTQAYWYDVEDLEADPEAEETAGFAFVADTDDNGTDDALVIYNFCGLPEPAIFFIDSDGTQAVMAETPLYIAVDGKDEYEFIAYPVNEDFSDLLLDEPVVGNLTKDADGNSIMDIDQVFGLYCDGAGVAAVLGLTTTSFNFTIEGTGEDSVEGIASDSNVAPVYYNLQGIQVANPTAGQIYIVKKGNEVSKTIIK